MTDHSLSDPAGLKARYGEQSDLVKRKVLSKLDRHCRNFIAASPFLVIATADSEGRVDASPRGDAPGFVAVLDERTLALPDRPGNKRLDTLGNLLSNPGVGMIFFLPGVDETLRVNGRAAISTDPALLERFAVKGKAPLSVLLVSVEEAYLHCAKALIRADLWNPEKRIDRKSFPTLGQMIADQVEGVSADAADARVAESIAQRLY